MPLSYYKRILFIALLFYIFLIILYKAAVPGGNPFSSGSNIDLKLPLKRAEIEGIITSYPRSFGKRFSFNIRTSKINGEKAKAGIIVYANKLEGFNFKDKVLLSGAIRNIYSDRMPGNLDWKKYLKSKGINGKMRNPKVELLEEAGFVFSLSRNIHEYILKVFDKKFNRDYSVILSGIVIGEKKNISKNLKRSFQDSGAMHLLVASGSNVGFMALIVYFLCALARLKKGWAYIISVLVCGIYVLSAGLDPPLIRAYIMFMFALAGFLISRQSGGFQGLLMSGFIILIYQPKALFDASFQMSFLAAYGIIVGMASWNKFIKGGIIFKTVARIFAVSLFAQMGLYPLMAVYFHKISLVSVFSNIIFVPFSGLLMALGLLTAVFAEIPIIGYLISQATLYSLKLFKFFVVTFGGFDYSAIFITMPSVFLIISSYILIFILLHMPVIGFKNKKMYAALGAALLIFLTGVFIKKGRDISLFYQGRYSCAFFKNPDCGLIVLNAGIAGDKLTGAVLESGYSEIEILLLSAVSENYIRGLKELSENIKIKKILIPFGYRSKSALKLFKDLKERGVEIQEMWPGEEKKICSFKIGPQWGLHFYPDGKFFRNTGYCGDSYFDRLSWHFQSAGFDFEFTRFGNGVRLYKSKKTIGQLGNKGIGDIKARKGKIIKIDI